MNQKETLINNKMIAEFMGNKINGTLYYNQHHNFPVQHSVSERELAYHNGWDWLMPVLDNVCLLKIGDDITTVDYAFPRTFGMIDKESGQVMVRLNGFQLHKADNLIDATYLAVVDFIKWYNTERK